MKIALVVSMFFLLQTVTFAQPEIVPEKLTETEKSKQRLTFLDDEPVWKKPRAKIFDSINSTHLAAGTTSRSQMKFLWLVLSGRGL